MSAQLQVTGEAKIRDIQGPVVANDGVITALDGAANQYVRGDGSLADFPTSTGGGSSVSYYLNSSVSQGTIGGNAYRELSKEPVIGSGTDITISSNGYIANYITDANDPSLLEVPGGNFNCEMYFSVNADNKSPYVYAELYKYDGSTFTLLGTSQSVPEYLSNGTTLAPYYFAIPVATAALTITDRLAIRIYVVVDTTTVTLHTENSHLCQVVTTFSKGLISLNNLTKQNQYFGTGTSGTDFGISSSGDTHTFNLPVASATNTGKLSSTDWSTFNNKVPYTGATGNVDLGTYSLFSASVSSNFLYANGASPVGGYISLKQGDATIINIEGYNNIYANNTKYVLIANSGTTNYKLASFELSGLTNNTSRTYTLPDASGTLSLTSDLSDYVPYTGANSPLDLGIYSITSNDSYTKQLTIKKNGAAGGALFIETGSGYGYSGTDGIAIASGVNNKLILSGNYSTVIKNAIFDLSSITSGTTRTYTLPDASGTLALTSNLSSYVPYTGATSNINLGLQTILAGQLISGYDSGIPGTINPGSVLMYHPGTAWGVGVRENSTLIHPGSATTLRFRFFQSTTSNEYQFIFNAASLTLNTPRTYTLPDASGTIALTSDLSGYVTLDTYQTINANKSFSGWIKADNYLFLSNTVGVASSTGYGTITYNKSGTVSTLRITNENNATASLIFDNTTNYGYTFPAASGTVALTSNLSSYLPLSGGILTGALSGTSATFSSTITSLAASGQATIIAEGSATNGEGAIQVKGKNSSGTSRTAQIKYDNSDVIRIGTSSAIGMQFETSDAVRLTIASTGAATFSSSVTIEGNGSTIRSGNELRFNRADNAIYTRMFDAGSLAANGFTFDNMNGEGFHFKNGGVTIMRMNSSGNVGIGTSSPSYKLHVAGNTYTEGVYISTGSFVAAGSSTTGFYTLPNSSNNTVWLISVRQQGSGANNIMGMAFAINSSSSATRFAYNSGINMDFSVSGLTIQLILGAGFGTTTWEYTITQIK